MNYLFENINARNQGKILKLLEAEYLTLPKNVNLFTIISSDSFLGLVRTGNLQIVKNDYSGNRTIVEDLNENAVFGSIITNLNSTEYEVIAKEETKIILIDYNRLYQNDYSKYEYYNEFMKNLLKILTDKIEERNQRIEILTKKTIRNKLLEYFRMLAKKMGTRTLYLPFSFTELADYLAVDRCAMSRELKYMKEEGFIKISSRRITLMY